MDCKILLWSIFSPRSLATAAEPVKNYNVLSGHRAAVLEMHWLNAGGASAGLVSCSADCTAALWDCNKGTKLRKFDEHGGVVNSCSAGASPFLFATASDDCTTLMWDTRCRESVAVMKHPYQVTSVCLSSDGHSVFTGSLDNIVRAWDARAGGRVVKEALRLEGHADTVTGLSLSPDGFSLVSNAMDGTLAMWDVKPFTLSPTRLQRVLRGHHHGAEKLLLRCAWSPDQALVAAGSADRQVHVWDADSGEQLYVLPGHKASVNQVAFHPSQPIVCSASSDRTLILGELAR
jgi:Prp8 binding protein